MGTNQVTNQDIIGIRMCLGYELGGFECGLGCDLGLGIRIWLRTGEGYDLGYTDQDKDQDRA